jgi:hypothetical protein
MHTGLTNSYPVGAWFDGWQAYLTLQVEDDQDWADICNGVYKGTSWAGLAEMVEIPEDLAAAIGIAPGTWLFNIEMMEDSYVDVPAVPAATFNSAEGDMWAEETGTLVEQLMLGKIKPRVRGGGMPKDKMMQPQSNGLLGMLQRFITSLNRTVAPVELAQSNSQEADMGLTPEEREELTQLSQTVKAQAATVETLVKSIADLTEAQNAANEPEPVAEPEAEPAPDPMEALNASIAEAVANATAPLLEEIERIKAQPAASGMIREQPAEKEETHEVPVSSLSADHPRRKAAFGK